MSTEQPQRAVVTGIGVIAPNGLSADTYWKSVQEGIGVLDRITREGCEHLPSRSRARSGPSTPRPSSRTASSSRPTGSATTPWRRPRSPSTTPVSAGTLPRTPSPSVVTAAGSGGGEFGQRELQKLWGQGSKFVGPYQSIAWFYAASTGQISIRSGFKGPCGVVASDEAGGLDALAHAARAVRRGTGAMVVGAAEAPLAPYSMVCQLGYPELSTVEEPDRAYRPFTAGASGFVPAEGGAVLVVEDEDRARDRGRPSGPSSPDTAPRSPAPPAGRSPGRGSPARSGSPSTRPAAPRRRSTSCSPTPWACRRRTAPRRWRSPTPWARTPPACPSRRPRPGSAAPTAGPPSWTSRPRCSRWNTAWCPHPERVRHLPRHRSGGVARPPRRAADGPRPQQGPHGIQRRAGRAPR